MSVKIYNRETKTFEIIKPKLVHIGSVKKCDKNNLPLTYNDKLIIYNFVEKVKYLGEEFGSRQITSFSNKDIFKIHDDFKKEQGSNISLNISNKNNDLERIKKQLGL